MGYNDYSLSAAPAVSVYVDDVPLAYPAMTQGAMLDLKRVEVLEGPQGTLFGQNSTGGLVNYIAQRPTNAFEAGTSLHYGRFNTIDVEGYASGPIAEGLKARLAFKSSSSDGWQRSLTRFDDTMGALENNAGRFILDWDPIDTVSVALNFNFDVNHSQPQAPQAIAIVPLAPQGLLPIVANSPLVSGNDAREADWNPNARPYREDRFTQNWAITDKLNITSISAYSDLGDHDQIDRDGMANANSEYNLRAYIHSLFQELRLQGNTGPANWTVGGNFSHDDTDEHTYDNITTSSD